MRTCTIVFDDGTPCDRPLLCKGMCVTHWQRARKGIPLGKPFAPRSKRPEKCALCDRPVVARGLCSAHYQRQFIRPRGKRLIAADAPVREKRLTDEQKVNRILDAATPTGDCLVAAQIGTDGYATSVKDSKGQQIKTHRLVYRVKNGPIPNGMQVHHICANRACIEPTHLVLATQNENMAEMHARRSYESHIAYLESEVARLNELLARCTCTSI